MRSHLAFRLPVVPALALSLTALAAVGGAQGGAAKPGSQPPGVTEIAGQRVEQVTVDAVVLDKRGNPVTGLTQDDFTVLEEGRPETISSFQLIDRHPNAAEAAVPAAPPRLATNFGPGANQQRLGRTFVIVFDDLHITPLVAADAKAAVAAFLDRGALEGDRVTLVSTSGSAWWSTRMRGGRDDLMAILKRLDGRRVLDSARERITDYEALQIFYYHDARVAQIVQERMDRYGTTLVQQHDKEIARDQIDLFARGLVDPFIESRAQETYLKMKARLNSTLEAIERATRALSEGPERKALLLVSEGFVDDPAQEGFRRVVEAARHVNAALYFVDAGGLRALDPGYSAEFSAPQDTRDTMAAIADLSREGEGAALLADETGGFSVRNTNGFKEAAVRIGRESQSYYLIGYNPGEIPHDGRFRKIEVKVKGPYTVRARRGYYAPTPDGQASSDAPKKGVDEGLQHALDAPRSLDAIPLRVTAYVLDEVADRTRVFVVADVDISHVQFKEQEGQPLATLDTLLVVSHRDSGEVQRTDQQVEIRRQPGPAREGPTWYSFAREVILAPGPQQAKLVVRDAASRRVGTVIYEFAVPTRDTLRVSTPILTDTLNRTPGGGAMPALLTRRTFNSRSPLYVRFDVFGAAKGPDGLPRVLAGHTLRHKGGPIVGRSAPTLIEPTSLGALARMVEIPLQNVAAGDYELLLSVRDQLSGESRELVEPFTVAPPLTASR